MSNEEVFINLINFAVFKREFKKADINFPEVLNIAKNHNLVCVVYRALTTLYSNEEIIKAIPNAEEVNFKNTVQNLEQQCEFERIIQLFKEQKLNFLYVKGLWIKQLYEYAYERSMGDADFLILKKDYKNFRKILIDEGYICKKRRGDGYIKKIFNIELHCQKPNKNSKQSLILCDEIIRSSQIGYTLPIDEHLIYLIKHLIGHMPIGTGVRMYLDIAIVCDKFFNEIDFEKIKNELAGEDLLDKAQYLFAVNEKWFNIKNNLGVEFIDDKKLTVLEKQILNEGIFGYSQKENRYRGSIINTVKDAKGKNKFCLIFCLLFPSYKFMAKCYPVLRKVPILLPIYWIIRQFKFMFKKKDLKSLFSAIDKINDKETLK